MAQGMATRCAVCELGGGLVVNIVVAAPSDEPPEGCQLVEIMADQPCNIGWAWNGSQFVDPNPPAPEIPPPSEG
jgi:hypothetical protein